MSKGPGELAQGVQEEVVEPPQSYRDDQLQYLVSMTTALDLVKEINKS